jgi:hypothetical protein
MKLFMCVYLPFSSLIWDSITGPVILATAYLLR